jgi:menaquinol-cytochrome c reductase iron-sulfur subunit
LCFVQRENANARPAQTFNSMSKTDDTNNLRRDAPEKFSGAGRRSFLLLLPSVIFAAIAGTLVTTAFRFLRPRADEDKGARDAGGEWVSVGPLSALASEQPVLQTLSVERRAGWSVAREERPVYVLPGDARRVVSAICPHERCEVVWRAEAREFECPCHDSRFDANGARTGGPAARDLDQLPTRVENDLLQVRLDV